VIRDEPRRREVRAAPSGSRTGFAEASREALQTGGTFGQLLGADRLAMHPALADRAAGTVARQVPLATPEAGAAWMRGRWPALVAAVVCFPLAVIAIVGTLHWPGHTFPGFFVLGNGVVPTVGLYGWTGMQSGVPFHARVIAVDGNPVRTSAEIYAHARGSVPGTPVRYTLEKDGATLDRTVATMRFGAQDYWLTVGLLAVFGLLSVAAGVIVGALQPHTPAARAFLVQGVFTGVFALTGTGLYHPDLWWMIHPHALAQAAFPAAFVHLGLVFPVSRRVVQRHPAVLAAPYVVALVLLAWIYGAFFAEPPDMTPFHATYVWSAVGIVTLIGLTVVSWVENRTPDVRPQLRAVLPGLVIGTAVGLYGFLDTARGGGRFPINLIALTPFLFYLSVAYAIARHDLFDIDVLVKHAVVYALLTVGITIAYAGLVALVSPERMTLAEAPFLPAAFVVAVAVLFQPLRRRVQEATDRLFDRERLDYKRTVTAVSAALTSLLDLDEILDRVGRTMSEGLRLRSLAVFLWLDDEPQQWRWDAPAGHMREVSPAPCRAIRERLIANPTASWSLFDRGSEDVAVAEALALDGVLVVPLVLAGEVLGAFVLGRPRSGRLFSRGDVALLETLAAQSAIAIGNARSYRALEASNVALEQKVEARTAALEQSNQKLAKAYEDLQATQAQLVHSEKMASLGVLVAGVAHEINNPVTFIVGGVQPLREAIDEIDAALGGQAPRGEGAIARARRAADAIARGAERTAGIVQDLRTFSHHGEARQAPVEVHEGIEVSLRLLRPRWADRIEVHRDFATVPPVHATGDELNQVWMNLLANACDAIAGRGNVWIRTALVAGAIHVVIRDDGAGMSPEIERRIFDPFFTTKAQGQGTGLGLTITHGIVARHGGRLAVRTGVGQGSEITVILPLRGSTTPAA
jgi:signal transduction histidine kinase